MKSMRDNNLVRSFVLRADAIDQELKRVRETGASFDYSKVIRIEKRQREVLGSEGARIRVLAASIEHNVVHAARADPINIAAIRGGEMIPGNAFVGEIIALGDEDNGLSVGDIITIGDDAPEHLDHMSFPKRAWGFDEPDSSGCYTEELVLPARRLIPVPLDSGLNLWELTSLGLKAPSAYHLWQRAISLFRAKVPSDVVPRLNVLAFGGGTSEAFLMLAKAAGHRAIYCASSDDRRRHMEDLGIETIDQRAFKRFAGLDDIQGFRKLTGAMTDKQGFHIVCDMFRGPVFEAGLAVQARYGVNISAGWSGGVFVNFNTALLSARQITLDHAHMYTAEACRRSQELYGSVLKPCVHGEVYCFEDLPRALHELAHGKVSGNAIVRVAEVMPDKVLPLLPEYMEIDELRTGTFV